MSELFTVPIATGGTFVVSQPAPSVYLLTFSSPPDNRLTTDFIAAYLLSLDILEHKYPRGVLISTSAIAKFFSNGLDLNLAIATPGFMPNHLYKLFRRLLTFPMPTVALINGHAFAGGFMLAMYHDYRVQNPAKGFLCLNEVLFGAVMESPMIGIYRQKIRDPATFRNLVLEGARYPAQRALAEGVVDVLGGMDETMKLIAERELVIKGQAGVYGSLKEEMYRETLALLDGHDVNVAWRDRVDAAKAEASAKALARVAEWEAGSKAKL